VKTAGTNKGFLARLGKYKQPYLMMSPTILMVILFGVYPLLYVLYYSFFKYDGFSPAVFVGLRNYTRLFKDATYWNSVINTLQMGVAIPLVQIPCSLLLATHCRWVLPSRWCRSPAHCCWPCC
jgi:raffinose/stachyose/melibiose transport system permease protein